MHKPPADISEFKLGGEPTAEGRHEVYLSLHPQSGKQYFLKKIGTSEVERMQKEDGTFTTDYARFLAEKEVCAGRLELLFLGAAHVPNDFKVVIDRKDGKKDPDYYVASQAVEHFKSLDEIDKHLSGSPLFFNDGTDKTRITINEKPRASMLVHGRIAIRMVAELLGEGDNNEKNVGIRLKADNAPQPKWQNGDVVIIDPECCFHQKPHYTAEELAHGEFKSIFNAIDSPDLPICPNATKEIMMKIATTDSDAIKKIFHESFSPNKERQKQINEIGTEFAKTVQLFTRAAEIAYGPPARNSAVSR